MSSGLILYGENNVNSDDDNKHYQPLFTNGVQGGGEYVNSLASQSVLHNCNDTLLICLCDSVEYCILRPLIYCISLLPSVKP